jgi:hypothetical protein
MPEGGGPVMEPAKRVKGGAWRARRSCVGCHTPMGFSTMMDSSGVCPFCGYVGSATVCETYKQSVRTVRHQERRWGLWWTVREDVEVYGESGDDG